MSLTFTIPSPPSVNNLYANIPGKGRVKSSRYRTWRQAAGWAMRVDGNKTRSWPTIAGPVEVQFINGNRRGDLDNGCKAVGDLLVEMGVISDDRLIEKWSISRGGEPKQAVVTVRELAERPKDAA